jgi:hypothetical protein
LLFVLFLFTLAGGSEKSSGFGLQRGMSLDCVPSTEKASRHSENAMQLDYVRREIERMRTQVHRQRGEIRQLQRAGILTASAEALLDRMLNKIDELCTERDTLKKEQPSAKGRVLGGRSW